ncbi:MAG: protein kinase domain-containing protein [Pseudonocardia sp.]
MEDETFGPYRLEALLGQDGMGEVYRAFDTRKARTIALKRLSRPLAADEEFTARFRREPATAARLRDPHVIPIHDFGEIDGQLLIDMRLVDGADLADVIRRNPHGLDVERAFGDRFVGDEPRDLAVSPDGPSCILYFTNADSHTLSFLTTSTGVVTNVVPVDNGRPFGVAVTPNGLRAYVTNS